MSRAKNCTLTCACGEVFSSPIYEYVNVAKDPQLQYSILAGLLNVSVCPSCGRRAAIARPLIYSDPVHNVLAYVHPRADAPEEARLLILEKLRDVYVNIADGYAADSEQLALSGQKSENGWEEVRPGYTNDQLLTQEQRAAELPPLQVVFGMDQLTELINMHLSQDERLGRLALSTHSRNDAERGRLLDIARKLASEMGCQIEVEDLPDEYTVWLYGPRKRVGAIMRELAAR